ncbi:MAG: hypothetical protein DWQ31_16930 [Planctomycetota bacterium]|nr:MAG: hypothetical protein DWQ31_16930 [Planctomycetota bacterium]REJ92039.1 MAG: hypothetical protein DWQ35_12880 [Planctomycetota bacterium]REK28575.1 MAG: hypothetical protein DWQ42_04470 [Planctomycetota bacterium]REK39190.1 MAG: hypothetical protein DWQ46_18055 [Planctomycetota bacterium]
MPKLVARITQVTDDGYREAPSALNSTTNFVSFGARADTFHRDAYLRFQGVGIPQGATINAAKLVFTGHESGTLFGSDFELRIEGHAADDATANPSTFTDSAWSTTTAATIQWDGANNPSAGEEFDSVDISAVVQEIVNRAGWTSGNGLMIFIFNDNTVDEDARLSPRSYDNTTGGIGSNAPRLEVDFDPNPPQALIRMTRQGVEVLGQNVPNRLRVTRQAVEVMAADPPPENKLRVTRQAVEVMAADPLPQNLLRVTRQAVEVMASDPFPVDGLEVTRQAIEVLGAVEPGLEVTRQGVEVLGGVASGLEVTRQGVEVLGGLAGGLEVTRQGVEVLGFADPSISVVADNSVSAAQTASLNVTLVRPASDALSLLDDAQNAKTVGRTASDALPLSGGAAVSAVRTLSAGNSLSFADQADGELIRIAASAIGLAQQASAAAVRAASASTTIFPIQVAEAIQVAERSATDSLALSDTAAVNATFVRSTGSSLSLTDETIGDVVRSVSTVVVLSQQAIGIVVHTAVAQSTVGLGGNANVTAAFGRSASNAIAVSDSAVVDTAFDVDATSVLSISDQSAAEIVRESESTILLSQQATGVAARSATASSNLVIDDSAATAQSLSVAASSTLPLSAVAIGGLVRDLFAENELDDLEDEADGFSPTIQVSALSFLFLVDSVTSNIKGATADDSLALSQTATVSRVYSRAAENPIFFTELTIDPLSFDEVEVDHGIFDQAEAFVFSNPDAIEQFLSFAQAASPGHVRADGTDANATSTLSLSDEADVSRVGDAESFLEFSQSATAALGKAVATVLNLEQQASLTIEQDEAAVTPLSLFQTVTVVFVKDTTEKDYTPFVGSTDDPNAPPPPSTTAPTLQKVDGIELYFPFDSPTTFVTLRGPEFNNRDRLSFQRINRETRGGTLVIFADPQWPKIQQLQLEFAGLTEDDAQALLAFIQASLGKEVGLRDWENRTWKGVILSTQEPIIRDGKKKISTALDIEGALA